MIIVLDTSAGAEIVLQREHADRFAGHINDADWIISPTLYISEISNVFWKYHTYNNLPLPICETGIDDAVAIPDEYIHEKDLYKEAFALGCRVRMPIYDMFFLVLARRYNAHLLTTDRKLLETATAQSVKVC